MFLWKILTNVYIYGKINSNNKEILKKEVHAMKSTGIVRKIDELGRIVVPKELRKKLGIANTDPVEIYVEGEKIILTKYLPVCHFCGSEESVTEFKEKTICRECIKAIKSIED